MSKRRWIALETLLTFWPPAPCARIACNSISASGMVMRLDIFIVACATRTITPFHQSRSVRCAHDHTPQCPPNFPDKRHYANIGESWNMANLQRATHSHVSLDSNECNPHAWQNHHRGFDVPKIAFAITPIPCAQCARPKATEQYHCVWLGLPT